MRSGCSVLVILLVVSAVSLRAQSSVPTLVQPFPAQTLVAGGTGATIDLRQHLAVPGVLGREFVQFETVVGRFNVELRDDVAPRHVANFLAYVQANTYANTFLHRAASFEGGPVSIVQGGGYGLRVPFEIFTIQKRPPVALEYNLANARGTLAAARTSDINSATSEWFFNVRDNSTILNQNNGGGYSVFGRVMGTGMTVVDAMAALPRVNAGSPFTELPVRNFTGGTVSEPNLVIITAVRRIDLYPTGAGTSAVQYSAESSATSVATATVSGSSLVVSPVGNGTATITVRAVDTYGNAATGAIAVEVTGGIALGGRLNNLSVRTAMAASQTLIMGFSVQGGAKPVLLRAVGPGLAPFGVGGTMTDPRLALFRDATQLEVNDNWGGSAALSTAFSGVGAFALPPASLDAALLRAVDGGHTAQVTGTGGGVVLVEAYDAGTGETPRFVNVSARNRVGTGDDILIAGFNVAGPGGLRLLVRAVGPKLASFGVGGVLTDPKLEIYNSQGVKVTENDNWSAALAATFQAVGAFALDAGSLDAALLTVLPPGSYTAQVSGLGGGTGEALVEIYEVR
ncbi:MAG: peptidylprolyl isomerase [Opitutaceae bacterium]|nr:peptidylprolyl isomerase [Opitutaceae bacterium]